MPPSTAPPSSDDYTPITRGSLKLKGVKDSKIEKKKKKKKKRKKEKNENEKEMKMKQRMDGDGDGDEDEDEVGDGNGDGDDDHDRELEGHKDNNNNNNNKDGEGGKMVAVEKEEKEEEKEEEETDASKGTLFKTEAERRYEETRRKRLDERLKREGVKTHKERVEELNKYLSNLSEHHDMPRIGPG